MTKKVLTLPQKKKFQSTLFIYEERNVMLQKARGKFSEFQSTLFIYEERNSFLIVDYICRKKFQSTLFIYEERNLVMSRERPDWIVSIHSLHLRREKFKAIQEWLDNRFGFNPLSSFTKREISQDLQDILCATGFQSTLFIYEERNCKIPSCEELV